MHNRHNQLSALVQRHQCGANAQAAKFPSSPNLPSLPGMITMTDDVRLPDPARVVFQLAPGSALILRHYESSERRALAERLLPLCRRHGIRLLIANDARLAFAIHADGLHVSENVVRQGPQPWRLWCPPHWLITAAAHSPAALRRAVNINADAALLAPVFPTASHPEQANLGILRFAHGALTSPLPVYALGGINASTIRRLKDCGIAGIAGIGGFQSTT
jgi:thiamine-phosphate pyrophosphorylase